MQEELIYQVAAIADRVGFVMVGTADSAGRPHMATARELTFGAGGDLSLTQWFCPETLANIQANGHVTLVVWDPEADSGYQLLGELEEVRDLAMLDGYSPALDDEAIPQVERALRLRIDQVLEFRQGLHSDTPLDGQAPSEEDRQPAIAGDGGSGWREARTT